MYIISTLVVKVHLQGILKMEEIWKDTSPIGKKIVLKISQDGSTIERYKSIKGAARSNKIDTKFLHSIIKGNRILDGFIWIELAT